MTEEKLLQSIVAAMPAGAEESAARCATALHERLVVNGSGGWTVLVGYGGGKDSSYTVAFVRLVQLIHRREHRSSFVLRTLTNFQPGMGQAVLANIARVYDALGMSGDPECELLIRVGAKVHPFTADPPISTDLVQRYREDVLMAGHRSAGGGRPTFCNSCNLDMIAAFMVGATMGTGVDLIITGDSTREQRMYQIWLKRLAERVIQPSDHGAGRLGFQGTVAALSTVYFQDLHGDVTNGRAVPMTDRSPAYFSVYDFTDYASERHWSFLTGFLGFEFDETAFNFTESDCGNPLVMAHLRGLRAERVFGADYADGIREYLRFGLSLMRDKDFPPQLVEEMRQRYTGTGNLARMRERARRYSETTYRLSEDHLVCMVFSPFTDGCATLTDYLRREQPGLVDRANDIRNLLLGDVSVPEPIDLIDVVQQMSGLSLEQLRHLARKPNGGSVATLNGTDLTVEILRRDPHKQLIKNLDGAPEFISGR